MAILRKEIHHVGIAFAKGPFKGGVRWQETLQEPEATIAFKQAQDDAERSAGVFSAFRHTEPRHSKDT